ncbi:MAG TPA: hypothetical protein VEN79_11935 [Terriglobia bacterium]|nr:hypothetical protein [Terriglobia bacterium]
MLGRSGLFSTLMIGTTTPCSAQSLRSYKRFRVPLSVSPFTELVLRTGIAFKDGGSTAQTTEEMQRMFVTQGANEVYARIATRGIGGGCRR